MSVSVGMNSDFLIPAACFLIALVVAVGFALWLSDEDDANQTNNKKEVNENDQDH